MRTESSGLYNHGHMYSTFLQEGDQKKNMIMQAKRFDEKANQERISSCPMAPPANQWGPSMPCRGYRERAIWEAPRPPLPPDSS